MSKNPTTISSCALFFFSPMTDRGASRADDPPHTIQITTQQESHGQDNLSLLPTSQASRQRSPSEPSYQIVFTRSSQLTQGSQRVSEKPTLFLTPVLPRFHCATCLPRKVRHFEAGEPAKSLNRWTRRERLGCVSLVHL